MATEKMKITLNILNKPYTLTIDSAKEELYRKAGKFIQHKVDRYSSQFRIEDKRDCYAMVMLDLALTLVTEEDIDARLEQMVSKLDEALAIEH
ncbi:MAG: cell division protein ZapA [Bacteroidaceae bacterium]|nr:cell division protein ZapA [Bacteroidaceae bacterium]MBR4783297.1 cell division protein ZapA [Bacteroidaceae bacterium]